MKFSAAAVMAFLAAAANAKVAFTNSDFNMTPGSPFTLTWTGNAGDVTIILATGESTALTTVEIIDSKDSGSSFTWTVPTTLATGLYAFEITDSETTNYSVQFSLTGTGSTASSSAVTASATASTSSASSASAKSTASSAPASSGTESSSVSTSTGSTTSQSSTKTSSSSTTLSTSSKTSTASSKSATPTTTATPTLANTNNGIKEKSPLAFILVTVATLMYFN